MNLNSALRNNIGKHVVFRVELSNVKYDCLTEYINEMFDYLQSLENELRNKYGMINKIYPSSRKLRVKINEKINEWNNSNLEKVHLERIDFNFEINGVSTFAIINKKYCLVTSELSETDKQKLIEFGIKNIYVVDPSRTYLATGNFGYPQMWNDENFLSNKRNEIIKEVVSQENEERRKQLIEINKDRNLVEKLNKNKFVGTIYKINKIFGDSSTRRRLKVKLKDLTEKNVYVTFEQLQKMQDIAEGGMLIMIIGSYRGNENHISVEQVKENINVESIEYSWFQKTKSSWVRRQVK